MLIYFIIYKRINSKENDQIFTFKYHKFYFLYFHQIYSLYKVNS